MKVYLRSTVYANETAPPPHTCTTCKHTYAFTIRRPLVESLLFQSMPKETTTRTSMNVTKCISNSISARIKPFGESAYVSRRASTTQKFIFLEMHNLKTWSPNHAPDLHPLATFACGSVSSRSAFTHHHLMDCLEA